MQRHNGPGIHPSPNNPPDGGRGRPPPPHASRPQAPPGQGVQVVQKEQGPQHVVSSPSVASRAAAAARANATAMGGGSIYQPRQGLGPQRGMAQMGGVSSPAAGTPDRGFHQQLGTPPLPPHQMSVPISPHHGMSALSHRGAMAGPHGTPGAVGTPGTSPLGLAFSPQIRAHQMALMRQQQHQHHHPQHHHHQQHQQQFHSHHAATSVGIAQNHVAGGNAGASNHPLATMELNRQLHQQRQRQAVSGRRLSGGQQQHLQHPPRNPPGNTMVDFFGLKQRQQQQQLHPSSPQKRPAHPARRDFHTASPGHGRHNLPPGAGGNASTGRSFMPMGHPYPSFPGAVGGTSGTLNIGGSGTGLTEQEGAGTGDGSRVIADLGSFRGAPRRKVVDNSPPRAKYGAQRSEKDADGDRGDRGGGTGLHESSVGISSSVGSSKPPAVPGMGEAISGQDPDESKFSGAGAGPGPLGRCRVVDENKVGASPGRPKGMLSESRSTQTATIDGDRGSRRPNIPPRSLPSSLQLGVRGSSSNQDGESTVDRTDADGVRPHVDRMLPGLPELPRKIRRRGSPSTNPFIAPAMPKISSKSGRKGEQKDDHQIVRPKKIPKSEDKEEIIAIEERGREARESGRTPAKPSGEQEATGENATREQKPPHYVRWLLGQKEGGGGRGHNLISTTVPPSSEGAAKNVKSIPRSANSTSRSAPDKSIGSAPKVDEVEKSNKTSKQPSQQRPPRYGHASPSRSPSGHQNYSDATTQSSVGVYGYPSSTRITADQVADGIPENASAIFHILDRRVNLDAHPADASFYSLLRSWVQDDPYRQIPPAGTNLLDYVCLPSVRRDDAIEIKAPTMAGISSGEKRKLRTCDVFSKVFGGKTANEGMNGCEPDAKTSGEQGAPCGEVGAGDNDTSALLFTHVARAKRTKSQKRKESAARMSVGLERLRSLGIDLSPK